MNRRRVLLGGLGVALLSVALAGSGVVSGVVPSGTVVSALGNDYVPIAAIGVLVLVLAAVVAKRGDTVDQTRMPDPESATSVPAPGDVFDETLGRWRLAVPFAGRELKEQVRDRLRDVAVETVRRTHNCDDDAARERVADGTWTDDSHATAFLSEDGGPSLGARLEATLHGDSWFVYGARRTAAAVADLESSGVSSRGKTAATAERESDPATDPEAGPGGPGGPGSPGGPDSERSHSGPSGSTTSGSTRPGPDPVADGGADESEVRR